MRLATAEQMREMDRRTIEEYGLPGLVLMENAGRAVADAAWELLPENGGRVLILAGKGNNGGDGFVAARHLAAVGVEVAVLLFAKLSDLSGDAATNAHYAEKSGLTIIEEPDDETVVGAMELADVIVDGLLGTGLSGDVRGRLREVIELLDFATVPIVAVDIPSGLDANTGKVLGAAVEAEVTCTFGLAKPGLVQYPGKAHVGELRVVDIQLPPALLDDPTLTTVLTEASDCVAMLPSRPPDAHKGDTGRVLVVGGSPGLTGAPAMTGLAAARAGAGLVTVAIPAPLHPLVAAKLTEVMTLPLPPGEGDTIGLQALDALLETAARADAVALGPGLSRQGQVAELVEALVREVQAPLVLDADGLNAVAGRARLLRDRSAPLILTPHPGEMARLLDLAIEEVQADRLGLARAAAERFDAVIVLKGAATVIADPEGEAWINPFANPGMASGGMGDILTGIIAALAAGGADPLAASVAGVYLH
ncbi:MAG: NAD(P)H-hydrate dehydratase, partial [Armatimonadetes bacterium]|nr:NAD(P)H-hydrate dehydratase [Armatimonadota bacterium]